MILESTLSFLNKHLTLYYAGVDSDSLPFSEGSRLVRSTASDQITYLKALALIADYLVVPPSFYFFWADAHHKQTHFSHLLELYKAGIVLSPIYTSMNLGTDFLEQKMSQSSSSDSLFIQNNHNILFPFFREMPVIHRDVRLQSGGYRDLFSRELPLLPGTSNLRREVEAFVQSPQHNEILLSRERLHTFLANNHRAGRMSKAEYRRFFYAANRSYYQQGAFTHDATISLLGAERYSILGEKAFKPPYGVLIAYDPYVVLSILEHLGITRDIIKNLSSEDLQLIRRTPAFSSFRDMYYQFAITLQQMATQTNRLSMNGLIALKQNIQIQAISRVFREGQLYSNRQRLWNIGEMTFFSVALGVTGFFVIPLIGALLGAVPILIYSFGLSPRLSDFVICKLSEKQLPFYVFVRELRDLTEKIRNQQQEEGDTTLSQSQTLNSRMTLPESPSRL